MLDFFYDHFKLVLSKFQLAVTKSNVDCIFLSWYAQLKNNIQTRGMLEGFLAKDVFVFDRNYCRTPDGGSIGPWCYINDTRSSQRWDYCDVCLCEESKWIQNSCPTNLKFVCIICLQRTCVIFLFSGLVLHLIWTLVPLFVSQTTTFLSPCPQF